MDYLLQRRKLHLEFTAHTGGVKAVSSGISNNQTDHGCQNSQGRKQCNSGNNVFTRVADNNCTGNWNITWKLDGWNEEIGDFRCFEGGDLLVQLVSRVKIKTVFLKINIFFKNF